MSLKITEPRIWYLWMLAGLVGGVALAMFAKMPVSYHGKAFWGCAPTYCVA